MDPIMRRELILEHYQNPSHKGLVQDDTYYKVNTNNESCIDNIDVMAKIENGRMEDLCFDGEACAISTSATSILIDTLLGKTIDEVKTILQNYEAMINEDAYDEEVLQDLLVYDEIYKQPNRKKCALLPAQAIHKILAQLD